MGSALLLILIAIIAILLSATFTAAKKGNICVEE
jgi:hypothetical protein